MEWLSKGALPMGIVFLAITLGRAARRKAGHVLAAREYPSVAEELGLVYKPSNYRSGVGTIVGEIDGLRVIVDPDDQRAIRVRFSEPVGGFELHTYEHNKRPRDGQRTFRFVASGVAGWFKTCLGTTEAIDVLSTPVVVKELTALRALHGLKTLSLTESGLVAVFDYGSPPYIPASAVREVVRSLVAVARELESLRAK